MESPSFFFLDGEWSLVDVDEGRFDEWFDDECLDDDECFEDV